MLLILSLLPLYLIITTIFIVRSGKNTIGYEDLVAYAEETGEREIEQTERG